MKNKNVKNCLQEYCHENCIDKALGLPIYDTKRIGGEDHCPIFQSKLTFRGSDYPGCTGNPRPSKKQAEEDAAETYSYDDFAFQDFLVKIWEKEEKSRDGREKRRKEKIKGEMKMLIKKREKEEEEEEEILFKGLSLKEQKKQNELKTFIYFDTENVLDIFKDFISKCMVPDNVSAIGYISKHHHMRDRLEKMVKPVENVSLSTTNAIISNGVDYYITLNIGMEINDKSPKRIILVTRDKFGQVLTDLIKGNANLSHVDFKFVSSLKDLQILLT